MLTDPECVDSAVQEKRKKSKPSLSFGESAKFLAQSPYIRNLAVLVIAYGMCINIGTAAAAAVVYSVVDVDCVSTAAIDSNIQYITHCFRHIYTPTHAIINTHLTSHLSSPYD